MNNLRSIRREQEMSQNELGRRTKIAQSVLSLIERGYQEPSKEMKRKISIALGYKIEKVFPVQESKKIIINQSQAYKDFE